MIHISELLTVTAGCKKLSEEEGHPVVEQSDRR